MNHIHLSLILPTYNSNSFIKGNVEQVLTYLSRQPYASELIVVDDGSRDNTVMTLSHMKTQHPSLTILANGKNRGKGYAIRHAFQAASGRYLVFSDSDLAYPIEEVQKILDSLENGSDVAIASRVLPESSVEMSPLYIRYLYTRHLMGRFFNKLVRLLLLPGIFDTQAGLKGFSREAAHHIFSKQTLTGFSFDVELLYLAKKFSFKIQQVPINFHYFFEETTIRFFRDTFFMLRDLLRIRVNDWRGRYG